MSPRWFNQFGSATDLTFIHHERSKSKNVLAKNHIYLWFFSHYSKHSWVLHFLHFKLCRWCVYTGCLCVEWNEFLTVVSLWSFATWHFLVMDDTCEICIPNLLTTTCSGVASPTEEWTFLEQSLIKKMNYRITTDDPIKVFSQQRFFQLDEKPQINQDNDL